MHHLSPPNGVKTYDDIRIRSPKGNASRAHYLFLLSVDEKISDSLFSGTDVFVKNFRTIDDLRLTSLQNLSDFTSNQGFTASRRAKEKNTSNVTCSQLFSNTRKHTGSESFAENLQKLVVQTTDTHFFKVEFSIEQVIVLVREIASLDNKTRFRSSGFLESDVRRL